MRIAPDDVPRWHDVDDAVVADRPDWVDRWMLGRASMNDLVEPPARLPMSRDAIARHLRAVWHRIEWFPDARR